MTHHAGFLADIIAHPTDDTPRLIYADWLDDHGEAARGEFIRVQCELATIPQRRQENAGPGGIEYVLSLVRDLHHPPPDHPVVVEDRRLLDLYHALSRREQELFTPHVAQPFPGETRMVEMIDPSALSVMIRSVEYHFRRGFVHGVTCAYNACRLHLDDLRKIQPVRPVKLLTWPLMQVNNLGPYDSYGSGRTGRYRLSDGRGHDEGDDWAYGRIGDMDPGTDRYADVVIPLLEKRWRGIEFTLPDGRSGRMRR